ncbi:MAG: hypothetical protein IKO74_11045 [Selenomonadaceae bacterium]|nr:hypothetical protein [Selenomonadaceae bacterium]
MRNAFGRFGITVREMTGPEGFTGQFDSYFLNGKAMSRDKAWQYIQVQLKANNPLKFTQ